MENAYRTIKSSDPKLEHTIFLGDWLGSAGTTISIRHGGKADLRNARFHFQDANLKIEGNRLLIKMPGFEKTMTIEEPPRLGDDGLWRMRLDGEVFLKQSHDLFVQRLRNSSRAKSLS